MAAAVHRILSFSRNAKALVSPLKTSAVFLQRYSLQASTTGEQITHTGQVYDENDPRRARFVGRQKEVAVVNENLFSTGLPGYIKVNKNFAIKLVAEEPVSCIEARLVSCDGGGGALGHPKVYINLDKETKVGTCGYCGLQFKQTHHH